MVAQERGDGSGTFLPSDDQREIDFFEDLVILPDSTVDDTDAGWGEQHSSNDERLLADRPPHWA